MVVAFVNLKKAVDSAHRETLWDLLHLRGIPIRIIGLLSAMYSGTVSAVKCGGGMSSFFPVNTGVRQQGSGQCACCSITFQHMHGLGTARQSCGTKSLWSIGRQHQDYTSCFC